MNGNQLPDGKLCFQFQTEQSAALLWKTEVRHEGDAKSDVCQIDEQVIAAQLNLRYQIQLVLLEDLVEKFTGGAFPVQHQDGIGLQFF